MRKVGARQLPYLQAQEDLALHLQAFIKEGLKVAPPVSLFGQAACLLAQLGLSLHQLIPKLPVAGMSVCCLVTLQPAIILGSISQKAVGDIWEAKRGGGRGGGWVQQGTGRDKAGGANGLRLSDLCGDEAAV